MSSLFRYNNQLTVLRNELRSCKKKATEQSKQIAEQQKLITDQQKQTIDYASRLDENDKKNEEISRKFSTLLQVSQMRSCGGWTYLSTPFYWFPQELNKCKTELQYWRSKSPATSSIMCSSCGNMVVHPLLVPSENTETLDPRVDWDDQDNLMQPPPTSPAVVQLAKVSHSASVNPTLKRKLEDGEAELQRVDEPSNSSNSNHPFGSSNSTEETFIVNNNGHKKARRAKGSMGSNRSNWILHFISL